MNAPENAPATYPINLAHEVLLNSDSAMCVEDVTRAIVGKKPTKADIKPVAKLLKELANLGMIEMEPRAGGVPFYRLIVARKSDMGNPITEGMPTKTYPPETLLAMVEEHEAEKESEPSFLAPEDYEMPASDPVLLAMENKMLAMANKMLGERLEGVAHALRCSGLPAVAAASWAEDLQPKVAALAGAYQMALADLWEREQREQRIDSLTKDVINTRTALTNALNEADRLRGELAAERQARQQDQSDAVDVKDAAVGYLVRVTKRRPRYVTKPERARDAALSAVRAGAGRAEVLAVVPVGVARRGAEWRGSVPRTKGD